MNNNCIMKVNCFRVRFWVGCFGGVWQLWEFNLMNGEKNKAYEKLINSNFYKVGVPDVWLLDA